jgi:hypothetical protein
VACKISSASLVDIPSICYDLHHSLNCFRRLPPFLVREIGVSGAESPLVQRNESAEMFLAKSRVLGVVRSPDADRDCLAASPKILFDQAFHEEQEASVHSLKY